MAKDNKSVEQITDMDVDFAQWYTDVCRKAELIDYSGAKGLFVLRPYGYAIWEKMQSELDKRFKETGHVNVSMPMLIPESLLQKEKDHVEGFAPEVAWVTMGGNEKLEERLCVRPTSETLFCEHFKSIIIENALAVQLFTDFTFSARCTFLMYGISYLLAEYYVVFNPWRMRALCREKGSLGKALLSLSSSLSWMSYAAVCVIAMSVMGIFALK